MVVFEDCPTELTSDRGIVGGGVAALLWMGAAFILHWGLLACIAVQAGLYIALTLINMRKHSARAAKIL